MEKRIRFEGFSPGLKIRDKGPEEGLQSRRIFLLSPANASGARAKMLFNAEAQFALAVRMRSSGAALGEVFSFISGLYFRGKLAYAERFADPPPGVAGIHIITAAGGLFSPRELMTLARLQAISATSVDAENPEYRGPLVRDLRRLQSGLERGTQVILLGSIATLKYVEPLLEVFGESLLFPKDFVGRGDMSRGGLLLRSSAAGSPLGYIPVLDAVRTGQRPAKLPGLKVSRRKRSDES